MTMKALRMTRTADHRGEAGLRLLLISVLTLLLAVPAWAHRQPEVVGTLLHDTENGAPVTKVTWRFHAHDAMGVLEALPEVGVPNLDDESQLIELAGYVASWVDYSGGEVLTLGAEVEGNYAYVYQLIPGHVTVTKAGILSDYDPAWSNLINIEEPGGKIHSVTFTADYPQGTAAALVH